MSVTIGINGFGRIARCLTRIVHAAPESGITIAAVNDLAPVDRLAYGLRRDSIRGRSRAPWSPGPTSWW